MPWRLQEYWDWSWDELASSDLPAVVQYVYAHSGGQRMHYVGHSLGTLIAFAALSEQQQLGMLLSAGLLSPIAYLDKVSSPLARAAAYVFLGEVILINIKAGQRSDDKPPITLTDAFSCVPCALQALYWLGLNEFDPTG